MSIGDDEGAGIGFQTMRGRDYPTIRQFTVFLENRVGQLLEVLRRFRGTGVRIVALNIHDSTECSIVRFVLTNPERGREVFERAGLAMIESDLIALELPDDPQPLLTVCNALLQAEVNLVQTYPLMIKSPETIAVALMVDNIDLAQETLLANKFRILNEDELSDLA
ncbi:MAG: acetolactate synthase [Pirellulaceae bacterium]